MSCNRLEKVSCEKTTNTCWELELLVLLNQASFVRHFFLNRMVTNGVAELISAA